MYVGGQETKGYVYDFRLSAWCQQAIRETERMIQTSLCPIYWALSNKLIFQDSRMQESNKCFSMFWLCSNLASACYMLQWPKSQDEGTKTRTVMFLSNWGSWSLYILSFSCDNLGQLVTIVITYQNLWQFLTACDNLWKILRRKLHNL